MKKLFIIPLALLMTAVLSVGCLAYSPAELEAREYEATKDDLSAIAQILNEDEEFLNSMLPSISGGQKTEEGTERYLVSTAYRQFVLTKDIYSFYEDYTKGESLKPFISKGYSWVLPIAISEAKASTL